MPMDIQNMLELLGQKRDQLESERERITDALHALRGLGTRTRRITRRVQSRAKFNSIGRPKRNPWAWSPERRAAKSRQMKRFFKEEHRRERGLRAMKRMMGRKAA